MAQVVIEGVFMGANPVTKSFDGKQQTAIYIDLYQPESTGTNKAVQIKTDDLSLVGRLSKEFATGSLFKCSATVNAYKNAAYFKLVDILA